MRNAIAIVVLLSGLLSSFAAGQGDTPGDRKSLNGGPEVSELFDIWVEGVDNVGPAIAFNSLRDEYLVVWSNNRAGGAFQDIYARRVRASDGFVLSFFTIISDSAWSYYDPDVAYSSAHDEYLVVYVFNGTTTDANIHAQRITWSGTPFGEFYVGRPDASFDQVSPAVTYNKNSDEYLVVYQNSWDSAHDIDAVRINASTGDTVGWNNIAAGAGQWRSAPDVAHCSGSNSYLVAYKYQPNNLAEPGDIFGKVVSWNMGNVSAEIHICEDSFDQQGVAVTATPGEFLAVWEDQTAPPTTTEILARRVTTNGTPLGPVGGFKVAGSTDVHRVYPAVDFGLNCGSLVIWTQRINSMDYRVRGRYVLPGQDSASGGEITMGFEDYFLELHPVVACAPYGDCMMAQEDDWPDGVFNIRGQLVFVHLFSDGFESGHLLEWQ